MNIKKVKSIFACVFVKAGKSNGECKFIGILEVKMQYGGFPTRAKTCLELVISILLPY